MIDIDKYEATNWGLTKQFTQVEMADEVILLLEEVKRLRDAIADIAIDMEAADESYMGGFIEDLRKVIE